MSEMIDVKTDKYGADITHISLSVDYNKGGNNVFSGSNESRGIFVYVTLCKMFDYGFYTSRGFGLFDKRNFKFCVMPLARNSQKKVDAVREVVRANAEQIAARDAGSTKKIAAASGNRYFQFTAYLLK